MAKGTGLESLVEMLADRIRDGVTRSLRAYMDQEFKDLKRKMVASGLRRGPGRPVGSGRGRRRSRPAGRGSKKSARPAVRNVAIEARRTKILEIVKAANSGISSVGVAKKIKRDPRGVGILLSGLAKDGAVRREGKLYRAV